MIKNKALDYESCYKAKISVMAVINNFRSTEGWAAHQIIGSLRFDDGNVNDNATNQ